MFFSRVMEKCISNMGEKLHSCHNSADDSLARDFEELQNLFQAQYCFFNSVDKALESITDLSMTMACNMQLGRRYTVLKQCAAHLHEHNHNRLRRSGFMSSDLFSPDILNAMFGIWTRDRILSKILSQWHIEVKHLSSRRVYGSSKLSATPVT